MPRSQQPSARPFAAPDAADVAEVPGVATAGAPPRPDAPPPENFFRDYLRAHSSFDQALQRASPRPSRAYTLACDLADIKLDSVKKLAAHADRFAASDKPAEHRPRPRLRSSSSRSSPGKPRRRHKCRIQPDAPPERQNRLKHLSYKHLQSNYPLPKVAKSRCKSSKVEESHPKVDESRRKCLTSRSNFDHFDSVLPLTTDTIPQQCRCAGPSHPLLSLMPLPPEQAATPRHFPAHHEPSAGPPADSPGGDSGLLAGAAEKSIGTEFHSPVPDGYRRGKHKYVAVFGTVMSGLGKGIFASSVAKLLKDKGLVVAPIKLEGYLNIDAGTLNPYRHGEVFVLDDGTECDMDLGTYERMLDQSLSRRNFTTSGQVFSTILERERHGAYLGRDVQWIPHVTGEVKRRIRELAVHGDGKEPADVVFVEVGGTVGDYENGFYIEALRELAFEEGPDSVCFVALTYVIKPQILGEQKSKAAQLGIKRLMEAGVQPHILAVRAVEACSDTVTQKLAMFSNVPMRRVFSMHDRASIYTIPDEMRSEGLDREILSVLHLHDRVDTKREDVRRAEWAGFTGALLRKKPRSVSIGITGKYTGLRDAYASIDKAVEHCAASLNCDVDLKWIETTDITDANVRERLDGLDGVIVPGGFGARGVEGKIRCVRYCRENGVPYLGICLGFQAAVIEFARNVLGLVEANSTEFKPACREPVISELPEQKKIEGLGGSMRLGGQDVELTPGTLASFLYDKRPRIRERFRHRYEVDPAYVRRLEAAGLVFSGRHPTQPIMQIVELPPPGAGGEGAGGGGGQGHPYFVGGQFHPELTSRPLRPQPMFLGLVAAAIRQRYPGVESGTNIEPALARWLRPPAAHPLPA